MHYKLLIYIIANFLLIACGQESNELGKDTVSHQKDVEEATEKDSTALNLLVVDDAEGLSQTYELQLYADDKLRSSEIELLESYKVDLFMEQEMQKYNFQLLALKAPGIVYNLSTKKSVAEGCFPVLFDHLSGLIFSHISLEQQYKHFESTDLSIESPFSGTWCTDEQGFLSKFISNSQLSIPGESVAYFFNSYLFSRGYLVNNELLKGLLSTGVKSFEDFQTMTDAGIQLTSKTNFKTDLGISPYDQALQNLYKVQNRRKKLAPKHELRRKYSRPVRDLESVEVVLDSNIRYDISKTIENKFHVVNNGDRKVAIQGENTCNPTACINALSYLEPKKLTEKNLEDLYHQLIEFDYSAIKEVRGNSVVGSNLKKTNFIFGDAAGYETDKVAGALNQIAEGNNVIGKYRFEPRIIDDPAVKTNAEIARVLLKEFETNNRRPMIVSANIYSDGRGYDGNGHALTLDNIKEINGDIWMEFFDPNGRNFAVKAGPEMRMESVYESRSNGSEILVRTSPFLEFDLRYDYLMVLKK